MSVRLSETTLALTVVVLAACGGNSAGAGEDGGGTKAGVDAGTSRGADGGPKMVHTDSAAPGEGDSAKGIDAKPTSDSSSGGMDAGGPCNPIPGSQMFVAACQSLNLGVMAHTGETTGIILTGVLGFETNPQPACTVVEGVDIMTGTTVVQHLSSVLTPATNNILEVLATGTSPVADIENRCMSNDGAQRIDPYTVVITGKTDGGTFKATCGAQENGASWPPGIVVTCHQNLDEPTEGGGVSVQDSTFMGMPFNTAMLGADAAHGAGGALSSIDSSVFIIPGPAIAFGASPIAAFNTTGWMGTVTEAEGFSVPTSQISLNLESNPFPSSVCPAATMGIPEAGTIPPPLFIGRITGMGGHGPFSTEAIFSGCETVTLASP